MFGLKQENVSNSKPQDSKACCAVIGAELQVDKVQQYAILWTLLSNRQRKSGYRRAVHFPLYSILPIV